MQIPTKESLSRDELAFAVLSELYTPMSTPTLLVNEYTADTLSDISTDLWRTRYSPRHEARFYPDQKKQYKRVVVRLPKSHDLFDFFLHGARSVSSLQTEVLVYGMNDEGIKGAAKKMKVFYGNCDVLDYKKRVRVLRSIIETGATYTPLEQTSFRVRNDITYASKTYPTVSYPGMFNDGMLDDGSRLLLDSALPLLKNSLRILDYATGSGIIAKILKATYPEASIAVLDNDLLALSAAQENLASDVKNFILGDSLTACDDHTYDVIISNPPIHTAKTLQYETLHKLISDAPRSLTPQGSLILVTQSRIKLDEYFGQSFSHHTILAETNRFTVWQGLR